MRTRLSAFWERLRSSYWFVPFLMFFGAAGLALMVLRVDVGIKDEFEKLPWFYSGGPEGARSVLSAIASSVITVAGVTFSMTLVALSLAATQYGPRVLRNFMRDPVNQVVFGTMTGTFVYCLVVLRTVRGLEVDTYVPEVAVTVGVVLSVVSMCVLIYFVHHIAESIQVATLISSIGRDIDNTIGSIFPSQIGKSAEEIEPDAKGPDFRDTPRVGSKSLGYVQMVDTGSLVRICQEADIVIRIDCTPGDFITRASRLVSVFPPERLDEKLERGIRSAFVVGPQRTPTQDVRFAAQQLVEVALRALSPSLNDPFTAIMCIDRLTAGLLLLTEGELPAAQRFDDKGTLRIIAPPVSYAEVVDAAYEEIRRSAREVPLVMTHLEKSAAVILEHARNPNLRSALLRYTSSTRLETTDGLQV